MRVPSRQSGACSSKQDMSLIKYRPVLFCLWLTAIIQIIYSNSSFLTIKHQHESRRELSPAAEEEARLNCSLINGIENRFSSEASHQQEQQQSASLANNQDCTKLEPTTSHMAPHLSMQTVIERMNSAAFAGGFILMAEAGKKKKKEKSEVVVISVQNSPAKGHGMYPIFIPSCGGHGGHGGGYGRRRRRRSVQVAYV